MKKLILSFLIFAIATMGAKAQIGGGYDSAFNFGGAGTEIKNVVRISNGDTYFYANIMGRVFFAGQEIDAGAYGSVPATKGIFGKVSSAGTQTLFKVFEFGALRATITPTGELLYTTIGNANKTTDFGNGITNNAWGYYMVKFDNTGLAQWIKKVSTGTNADYGNGVANPTVHGLTTIADGSIFMLVDANSQVATAPYLNYKYPHRVIKYDASGNEIWHNEFFSNSLKNGFKVPEQFVSNNGNVTFGIYINSNEWYVNNEDISAQMSNYSNNLYSIIISLNADGTKNFNLSDTQSPTTLSGVNPTTGDLHILYTNANVGIFPGRAPFNTLPNYYPNTTYTNYYLFNGTLKFNSAGVYQNFVLSKDAKLDRLITTTTGFIGYEDANANNVVDKGSYVFSDPTAYGVISYYDASFNFIKAIKTPQLSALSANGDKAVMGGLFKGTLTFGTTTLTQSFNDTDFATRFPVYASLKNDIFIATADVNNITPPAANNWLGVDNNWNNVANWSTGVIPNSGTIVGFNSATAIMPTVGTTPKALRVVIDAGVTAELPANLGISTKLIINGKLQINHTGDLTFSNYNATGVEGTGTLEFKGTTTATVTNYSYTGHKDLTLETNDNINFYAASTYKKIKFTGTSSILKFPALDITSTDENAISGHSETNFIEAAITRAVNTSGTYIFPGRPLNLKYEPATLMLNNLLGVTKIKAEFKSSVSAPTYKFPDGSISSTVLGSGSYGNSVKFTADATPIGGTYDVTLQRSSFTNGVLDANKERYVILTDSKFQGTKLASTQVGGTITGQVVKDALVTAGIAGLSKFGEFIIGVNSAIVPVGTGTTIATWTGAANGDWNNIGNWSTNAVPNSLTDVTIPVSTVYPSVYSTTDFVNSLTINSGVLDMTLSHVLGTNFSITNHGDIKIAKVVGTSTLYSGAVFGQGKTRFEANSGLTGIYIYTENNVEFNVGNANTVNVGGTFLGAVNIKSGKLTTYSGTLYPSSPGSFQLLNSNISPNIQKDISVDGISAREFVQKVNTTGTYFFPLVSVVDYNRPTRNYGGLTIKNNGIAEATNYKLSFAWLADPVSVLSGQTFYRNYVNSGVWFITPDKFSTTGTVDLNFQTSGYSAGSGRANVADYVLLRKANNSIYDNGITPWQIVTGAVITENAGVIRVIANGQPAFSTGTTFCIGTKANETTWTGTKDMNWDDVANWSNGLPNPDFKAIIANASRYPNNVPTNAFQGSVNNPAIIEISSGTVISLPAISCAKSGFINNGTIKVTGAANTIFTGFKYFNDAAPLSGTGKLVFDANSPGIINYGILNNSIDIDRDLAIMYTANGEIDIKGNVNLISGTVTMAPSETFTMSNPSATFTASANASIVGPFKRKVNGTGTYNFPVGNTIANLTLNGLVGTTDISTTFSTAAIVGQPNLNVNGQPVNSILGGGTWFITPNTQPTAGTYSVTLSAPLGSSTANSFYIIKREDNNSYYQWKNLGINGASTILGGIVTASSSGLTSFSQFGIGEGFVNLPVTLVKFSATAESKSAKLTWETASELNNDKFEIQRSSNGIDFVKIGEVKGNGTSQIMKTYYFKDFTPTNGVNYYRLKQLDFNGTFTYSDIKFVNFDLNEITFTVFPNPVTEVINFSETVSSFALYDLQGKLVMSRNTPTTSIKIPTNLTKGIYVLKVKSANGTALTKQIIVTR